MRLWTRQHVSVWEEIMKVGCYFAKKEHIELKNDTISDYYLELYHWYIRRAEKIVPRERNDQYPIWASTSYKDRLQVVEDTYLLELEVPEDCVVVTDFDKWGYVVNYWYVPEDKEDERKHNEELEKMGIGDESAIVMGHKGNFYPLLRDKILKSWDRIFEIEKHDCVMTQATLWEIKKEWVIKVENYKGEEVFHHEK